MNLTIGKLKELIVDMPDDALVMYHAYYKGCCLGCYREETTWTYPKDGALKQGHKPAIVMNPDEDYDPRKPNARLHRTSEAQHNEKG